MKRRKYYATILGTYSNGDRAVRLFTSGPFPWYQELHRVKLSDVSFLRWQLMEFKQRVTSHLSSK